MRQRRRSQTKFVEQRQTGASDLLLCWLLNIFVKLLN